jgi:hypothetical protein
MERVAGIGPAYLAWEASALPLSYTRRTDPMLSTPVPAFNGGYRQAGNALLQTNRIDQSTY